MGTRPWRVAVAGFDHMHAGDQIAIAQRLDGVELVGVWDPQLERLEETAGDLGVDPSQYYTDLDALLSETRPDIVIVCSTTEAHLDLVRRLAAVPVHIVLEKPFAVSLEAADAMIAAVTPTPAASSAPTLSVNWPLAWYPPHRTTRRLLSEGLIGEVVEVHYFNGNRGPLEHLHGKAEATAKKDKAATWWYSATDGGGSLLDYLGYGATLATWYRDGRLPEEVTARMFIAPGLEVDEQSVVIAKYDTGLSVFQTKWGTLTDPWRIQGQPRHGFVVVGTRGTISSEDYSDHVTVQTTEAPEPVEIACDVLHPAEQTALGYLIDRLERGLPIEGPSSWEISRSGQQIVDAARESARTGRTVPIQRGDLT